jgi:hypothetical protein
MNMSDAVITGLGHWPSVSQQHALLYHRVPSASTLSCSFFKPHSAHCGTNMYNSETEVRKVRNCGRKSIAKRSRRQEPTYNKMPERKAGICNRGIRQRKGPNRLESKVSLRDAMINVGRKAKWFGRYGRKGYRY